VDIVNLLGGRIFRPGSRARTNPPVTMWPAQGCRCRPRIGRVMTGALASHFAPDTAAAPNR